MSKNTPIVSIKNLSHKYGKDWAIQDINFDLDQTGITGLLGSNGAGKSTTMNILCGIISQTEGTAKIKGYDVKLQPIKAKSKMGFLPQKAPLYQELTVDEYLHHCAHLRQIPWKSIARSVNHVKDYCGLNGYDSRLIGNLSGGYQQRVGIAQAIIHRPKLVVLDEPTNGLDPVQITEVRNLIREISKECAVLLSTHILSEVQAVCQKIIMIEKGRMVYKGSLNDFNNQIKPNKLIIGLTSPPHHNELSTLSGISNVQELGDDLFQLTMSEDSSIAETIVPLSVEKGWGIFELHKEKVSLDSVFAKLSNRELKK